MKAACGHLRTAVMPRAQQSVGTVRSPRRRDERCIRLRYANATINNRDDERQFGWYVMGACYSFTLACKCCSETDAVMTSIGHLPRAKVDRPTPRIGCLTQPRGHDHHTTHKRRYWTQHRDSFITASRNQPQVTRRTGGQLTTRRTAAVDVLTGTHLHTPSILSSPVIVSSSSFHPSASVVFTSIATGQPDFRPIVSSCSGWRKVAVFSHVNAVRISIVVGSRYDSSVLLWSSTRNVIWPSNKEPWRHL